MSTRKWFLFNKSISYFFDRGRFFADTAANMATRMRRYVVVLETF